jgi:hypothetical protein
LDGHFPSCHNLLSSRQQLQVPPVLQLSYQLLFIIIMNNGRSFSRPTRSYSESSVNNNNKGCRRVVSVLSQTDIPPSVYGDNYWLPARATYEGGANVCSVTVLASAKSSNSSKPSTTL